MADQQVSNSDWLAPEEMFVPGKPLGSELIFSGFKHFVPDVHTILHSFGGYVAANKRYCLKNAHPHTKNV